MFLEKMVTFLKKSCAGYLSFAGHGNNCGCEGDMLVLEQPSIFGTSACDL